MFLKVTLHVQPLPQKHVYQVFQWMIYLVERHGKMNLPGKNSIISKCFQRSNFLRRGTKVVWQLSALNRGRETGLQSDMD